MVTGTDGGKNILGTTATFTCDANYEMVGDAARTCQDDGAWSGTQPRCVGTYQRKMMKLSVKFTQRQSLVNPSRYTRWGVFFFSGACCLVFGFL